MSQILKKIAQDVALVDNKDQNVVSKIVEIIERNIDEATEGEAKQLAKILMKNQLKTEVLDPMSKLFDYLDNKRKQMSN